MDNEMTTHVTEESADQRDAFLDGWDDEPSVESEADQPAAESGEQVQPEASETTDDEDSTGAEAEADAKQTETPVGDAEGEKAEAQQQEQTPAATWTVKHMGEEKTYTAADVTPELLQKGLDYDRIRTKYDEAKPVMEMFTEFAKRANMSVADYAKFIRTEAKKASGMNDAEAKRTVELEDREAAVAAKEAADAETSTAKAANEAKIKSDLEEFGRAFPEVYNKAKTDPKTIPQSVWADVQKGMSLTAAYSRYAVAQAEATAKAATEKASVAAQTRKNAERSTGSMRSAGNDSKVKDPFLEGWDS